MTVFDVVVVGGGIAGLATAYELHRHRVSFVVLERGARPGGVILSEEIDGFTIDAGPDSLLIQKPEGLQLCRELGLGDRLVAMKPPRLAFVQRGGRLHPLPTASVLGIPTRWGPFIRSRLLTWRGKLRMSAELFVPPRGEEGDESLASFMTRRFGREATTYLAEPLLAGIHAGDVNRLSVQALFPRLVDTERKYGSLLRAFRRQQSQPSPGRITPERNSTARASQAGAGPPAWQPRWGSDVESPRGQKTNGPFRSLPGGLSEIVGALVRILPSDAVRLGAAVTRVSGSGPFRVETGGGETVDGRSVVFATPAYVTGALLRERDADLARRCLDVPYASTATVALAFARGAVSHPLSGSGFVVPRVEGTGILAASWLSSKWPHRAPEGRVLLRTFAGGARDPDALNKSDAELVALSLGAVRPLLGVSGEPLFTRVYRWERASVQYEVGHLARLGSFERALERHPGLFVTGSGFRGVGIPDCVADARATAGQVTQWLQASAATPRARG